MLNTLTGLSLLLCLTAAAMGVRSRSVSEGWYWASRFEPPSPGEKLPPQAKGWRIDHFVASGEGRVLWSDLRQYRHDDAIPVAGGYRKLTRRMRPGVGSFGTSNGRWSYRSVTRRFSVGPAVEAVWAPAQRVPMNPSGAWVSFGPQRSVAVAWWAIALVTGLPAAARAVAWLPGALRRRNRAGLCGVCGYDLRATPDRCPECGAAPARSPA